MRTLTLSSLAICLLSSGAAAQEPGPRHVLRPRLDRELRLDPASYHQDRLVIKFREGARVRLIEPGKQASGRDLVCLDRMSLGSVRALLGSRRVQRVFTRAVEDLDRERAAIQRRLASPREHGLPEGLDAPADLNNFFRVFTQGAWDSRSLLRDLLEEAAVETAYPEFHRQAVLQALQQETPQSIRQAPQRVQGDGRTPLFETTQFHLLPSPLGLGHNEVLGILGALGNPGQSVVQLEAAWIFDHEDLPTLTLAHVLGRRDFTPNLIQHWSNHGTAAAGILHAARDDKGVRGLVPCSRLYMSSLLNGIGNMVSIAAENSGPGDVFSASMVYGVIADNRLHHTPIDWPQEGYDAIRNAVLKGITVAVAAGNTASDLGRKDIFGSRYLPSATPSGAVICAATYGPDKSRVSWSSYGDAVKANAWGVLVTTTGYGHMWSGKNGRQSYTHIFNGTSAATPQVAGTLAAIQSVAWMNRGRVLSPKQLIDSVTRTGVTIAGKVGVRPNILATLTDLGLYTGLRVRNEPRPGQQVDVELDLEAASLYLLLVSDRLASLELGLGMPFLLEQSSMLVVASGALPDWADEPAVQHVQVQVPMDGRFSDRRFFFQALHAPAKGRLALTNAATVWVR
ncbi:MAG: S8 family serine peptidase [Planctomycetota bacterium]